MNRTKNKRRLYLAGLLILAAALTTGYAKISASSGAAATGRTQSISRGSANSQKLIDTASLFDSDDLNQSGDMSAASEIRVADNKNASITKEGTYVLRGTAQNSTITVNAPKNSKIRIILDGVNITNMNSPAIYVKSAGKVSITTSRNSANSLKTTGNFASSENSKADAVIFSTSDLLFNGSGKLTLSSSKGKAVSSEDRIKITGGEYTVTSEGHSFNAANAVIANNGNFTISTEKDAFHSENDADNTKGLVYISGGNFNIRAADDGIQATTFAIIDGGTFKIDAAEGIEATHVQINNGTINIQASDDGINAAGKTTAYKINLEVNGGNINVVMAEGDTDGFDSNGDLTVNGGNINVTARSAFDFDGVGKLNGGTVIVNGSRVTELPNQTFGGGGRDGRGRR